MALSAVFDSSTDQDWFLADLSAGTTYIITLSSESSTDFMSLSAFGSEETLSILSPFGLTGFKGRQEIDYVTTGENQQLVFTPREDGLFYVQAGLEGGIQAPAKRTIRSRATWSWQVTQP